MYIDEYPVILQKGESMSPPINRPCVPAQSRVSSYSKLNKFDAHVIDGNLSDDVSCIKVLSYQKVSLDIL